MPVDHLGQGVDHDQRTHPRVVQRRPGRVPETEPAHGDVERALGQFRQTEAGQLDLALGEEARHQVFVAELDLVHVLS